MGILDTVGEIAGAVLAVEAVEKLDPDAGFLTKAAAAIAGFKAAEALGDQIEKLSEDDASDEEGEQAQA